MPPPRKPRCATTVTGVSAEGLPLNFSASYIGEIEQGLGKATPGGWRRLRADEADIYAGFRLEAAWRVEMPSGLRHPLIDHVVVGVDAAFPYSDPVVIALQGVSKGAPRWPHIDPNGVLCLARYRYSSPATARVLSALQDAVTVLDMLEDERDAEHRREFLAYWSQQAKPADVAYLCILDGAPQSRDIVYYRDSRQTLFVEDAKKLQSWLSLNRGKTSGTAATTRLIWLDQPLLPAQFPRVGRDVIDMAGWGVLDAHVRPGSILPVMLGCEIDGVAVYACVEIEGISAKGAARGFRPSRPRPASLLVRTFQCKPATRRVVQRADHAWVHGRGKNPEIEVLRQKKVAVVGCGALGGYLARALAQSGVGSLLLIDPDKLAASNVGRHLLGMDNVGLWKSIALAKRLKSDFPHAISFEPWVGGIDFAKPDLIGALSACDLIIAAGIDLAGELALDQYRKEMASAPPLVWTWIEESAATGHAVALFAGTSAADALDEDGQFVMRLTSNWPAAAHAVEAGCAVAYQPYSAADMMGTINCAHRLALDVLLGRQQVNIVRSWLGDRDMAAAQGAQIDRAFDRSFAEITRHWCAS